MGPRRLTTALCSLALCQLAAGCQELPADVDGYETRCIQLNQVEHGPTPDDPHKGYKTVYACADLVDVMAAPPWPDGTMIVKESRRGGQGFAWLVATARKDAGAWSWEEYTRNFAEEPLLKIGAAETLCIDCHKQVEANDWIFTVFDGGAAGTHGSVP